MSNDKLKHIHYAYINITRLIYLNLEQNGNKLIRRNGGIWILVFETTVTNLMALVRYWWKTTESDILTYERKAKKNLQDCCIFTKKLVILLHVHKTDAYPIAYHGAFFRLQVSASFSFYEVAWDMGVFYGTGFCMFCVFMIKSEELFPTLLGILPVSLSIVVVSHAFCMIQARI